MSRRKLLQVGKVKEVYSTEDPDILEFVFTDKISVFDKVIPSMIPDKGETICRTASHWFKISTDLGLKTHFIDNPDGNRMRVQRVDVIRNYDKITPETTNYLIPLEAICRYFLAGSMFDRVRNGKVKVEELGFPSGYKPKYGDRLPQPLFEVTTKLEPVDRKITKEEAMDMCGLTEDEFEAIRSAVLKVDKFIGDEVETRGLVHVDGKKEFAFDKDRKLMLIDTFGTADEDRFWDKARLEEQQECIELSKEMVRMHYRGSGYLDELMVARDAGQEEPPIPALEDSFIHHIRRLYIDLFERLTGTPFR